MQNFVEKYKDCVGCVFEIGVAVSSLTIPLRKICPHNPGKTLNSVFEVSKIFSVLSCVVLVLMVVSITAFVKVLLTVCETDNGFCAIMSADLLYGINGFCLKIFALRNMESKVKGLNGWSGLVENRNFFGIKTVFSAKLGKSLANLFYKNIFLNFLAFVLISLYYCYVLVDVLDYVLARYFIALISVVVQIDLLMFLSVQSVFFLKIFECFQFLVVENLKSRPHQRSGLCDNLKKLNRFLLAINENVAIGLRFYNVALVMFMGVTIANLIGSLYLTVKFWGTEYLTFLILVMGRTAFTIFGIVYLMILFQRPVRTAEDIVSFLFKYPVSKLKKEEASQVETLLATLIVQKIDFRAGDLFKLDTKLLSSVGGTVVTYVLVALQFRTSLAD